MTAAIPRASFSPPLPALPALPDALGISVSLWSCSLASVPRSEPRGCDSYARTGGTPTTAPGSGAPPGVARPTRGDPTRWDERLFASKHERVFPVKDELEQVFAPNA